MSAQTVPTETSGTTDIAVVGQAGRFPGANDLKEFWDNLRFGVEAIRFYSEKEVIDSGVFPEMARDPSFVAAAGGIDHENEFDAEFFGFSPRDAEITDPQQRIALECAWEALESAGYVPETYRGRIGVFAGVSINTYLLFNLAANRRLLDEIGHFQVMTANDKDFLATRIAYKMNLKGPAMSVQTACSTGLVAVNLACQSLLNYQSDMVLAGGSSITPKGRLYKEGFIFSKDGRCRAFDQDAQGTVGGNGVGFVVLKRLEDALADGDHIHAIVKGSAINNDGSLKVGYTAPSVTGQVEVILEAQAMAGVDPDTITYVEAHGTGTLLGDPIEVAALTQAFRTRTERKGYCALGSVKTNIGHLDTAAGVSGLIKAVLAVEHGEIPPSLHCQKVNPKLGLESSPFYVNTELREWKANGTPRRAAVSSFGFGGTNAHTILEQAPRLEPSAPSREAQLLLVSGRDEAALQANLERLGKHLGEAPQAALADVAYTLQVGRKPFAHRAFLVSGAHADAAAALSTRDRKRIVQGVAREAAPGIVFMFSGQGSQYAGMARGLYEREPGFREAFDEVAAVMKADAQVDVAALVYPAAGGPEADALLQRTAFTQPALFAVEYALAKLWERWGVTPSAMIGHSVGEYVAATLAGVFSVADAARLVCARGRVLQAAPEGAMLSVPLPEAEVLPLLGDRLSLAASNAPGLCVVAGDSAAVDALQAQLAARSVGAKRLVVSHAFHSHLVEAAAAELEKICAGVTMNAPTRRYVSNVTGEWITPEQATNARYWADHVRGTVRFSQGLRTLLAEKPGALLEVGPGQVLTALARQHRDALNGAAVIPSTRRPDGEGPDLNHALAALGQLWLAGASPDWAAFHHHGRRQRVPLPTYAFQRRTFWLPPVARAQGDEAPALPALLPAVTAAPQPAAGARASGQPPRDETERLVAGIWEKALGVSPIGVEDDFFRLGGHSLLATQLVAEVARATRTELSVQALFKEPTIAALAAEVKKLKADQPDYELPVVPVIAREGKLPLTFHQQVVWDFERRWPGTSRFNGCVTLRLTGELDREALHFAVDEVFRRHEVLRTNYRHADGVSEAVVQPPRHMEVPFHDLGDLPPATRERRLLQLANEMARRPFDLTSDVYIRPALVKVGPKEHMLVIASHYVAVDGWTIGLVIREFAAHYGAFRNPNAPRLPELPFQMVDYAAWQRQRTDEASIAPHLPYWREQLAGVGRQEPVRLDRRRPLRPSIRGATFHFGLGRELTEAVKAFSTAQGTTTFMTFVAALDVLYHMHSGTKDVVIGTMTGDRELGTEAMVGSLVNMLPLRTRLRGDETFLQTLDAVRKTATDAYAHPVPFEMLVERLGRDLYRDPLFRTVFILRNIPQSETRADGLDVALTLQPTDRGVADMDLTLYLQEKQGAFQGYFEYATDLFDRSTIEALAGDFVALLRNAVAAPEAGIRALFPEVEPRRRKPRGLRRVLSLVAGEAR